jgi:hypothetical protein
VPSEPTPADVSAPRDPADPVQLGEELSREKQEVLRLRDLLIARDAELGTARGRVMELEARARYVLGALRRLRSLSRRAGGLRGPRS